MNSLRDHLQAVRDQHGELNAVLVVDAARDPDHPLHSRFEWDDGIAAERYRLVQAGELLRVVKRPDDGKQPRDLRAFTAVKGADSHRSDYVPTEEAMADPLTRLIVLREMDREWRVLKRRYEHMSEFAQMIQGDVQAAS